MKKVYFHTGARNKNKPIFLHLEWDWDEKTGWGGLIMLLRDHNYNANM